MIKIEPIQTYYKGYKFRSRLEARWAVFFDTLGIKYEYEPEGYVLNNGKWYLPDFKFFNVYLRNKQSKNLYVEIKADNKLAEDVADTNILNFDYDIIVFGNQPFFHIWPNGPYDVEYGGFQSGINGFDNYMFFWKCERCGTIKIENCHSSGNQCPKCGNFKTNDKLQLYEAALAARQERFENRNI